MKILRIKIVVLMLLVVWTQNMLVADEDWPEEYEDRITVPGKRINYGEDGICSDGVPEFDAMPCIFDLTSVPKAVISGVYGEVRIDGKVHEGIDLVVVQGTAVYALKCGWVYYTYDVTPPNTKGLTLNGNSVRGTHDDGTVGVYIHLESVSVLEHQTVEAGQQIGKADNTGSSRGHHIHNTQYTDATEEQSVDPYLDHSDCN